MSMLYQGRYRDGNLVLSPVCQLVWGNQKYSIPFRCIERWSAKSDAPRIYRTAFLDCLRQLRHPSVPAFDRRPLPRHCPNPDAYQFEKRSLFDCFVEWLPFSERFSEHYFFLFLEDFILNFGNSVIL